MLRSLVGSEMCIRDSTITQSTAFEMELHGSGSEDVSKDEDNFLVMSCKLALESQGALVDGKLPPLKFVVRNDIPFGCGVGSSSAAAVAGYMGGLMLCDATLPTQGGLEAVLNQIVALEGHPDNAAPAIYGGMQIGYNSGKDRFHTVRVPVPSTIYCVLFVPSIKMKQNTHATRGLVPQTVPMDDAAHNMARTSIITLAMATSQLHLLKDCLDDRFHQPQRYEKLFPHAQACVDAAMDSGAVYSFLSGAGPTICSFVEGKTIDLSTQDAAERKVTAVADAMVAAAKAAGIPGRAVITAPSQKGAHAVGMREFGEGTFVSL
eukprot:TRINITY_DN44123_c0_g2_i2.p1 TRINITY_DN44123_c0_g2~~TRINITY_DN44123_c0_g2_i2.p1  ORF type:complete len:368 (-),score=129.51 TRINITY_DN44123_c0_g2_i2:220-1179(-)